MSIEGKWAWAGAFSGTAGGALIGIGQVSIGYFSSSLPHHCTIYPLRITLVLEAFSMGLEGIIPGAIIGALIGVKLHSIEDRRQRNVPKPPIGNDEVWPPSPYH